MAVKVILQQDVPSLGHAGEIKQVAPGYFRNFLAPRGLAVEASAKNVNAHKATITKNEQRVTRAREQSSALARRLQDVTLRIPVRMGEQGRLYGSVTNKDIASALEQQENIALDRHKIVLDEPLKTVGMHSVTVHVDQGVDAHVRVDLVPEAEGAAQ